MVIDFPRFDAVSKLPRRQQGKMIALLEPFVSLHTNSAESR